MYGAQDVLSSIKVLAKDANVRVVEFVYFQ
jgi:hypothetical protein